MKWLGLYLMESPGVFRRLDAVRPALQPGTLWLDAWLAATAARHDVDQAALFIMTGADKWEKETLYPHPDGTLRERPEEKKPRRRPRPEILRKPPTSIDPDLEARRGREVL